jgi:hypothetical protein
MLAIPSDTFCFEPVMKYYVSHCDSLQGEILYWWSWSTNAGIIDFSGQPDGHLCRRGEAQLQR